MAAEEWLPAGWTVETKVRKNGKKDRWYINPSNESKFNSKPEVLRYLKSLENIHPMSEGIRRSSRNRSTSNSPALPKRAKVADTGTNGQEVSDQSSEPVVKLKDEKILEPFAGGEATPVRCTKLPETMDLDRKEKNESINDELDLANVPEAPHKKLPEVEKTGNKGLPFANDRSKSNNTKPDVPRRASKRLAGVEVGPILELNPINRTRQVSARRVDDTEATTAKSSLNAAKAIANDGSKEYNKDAPTDLPSEDRKEAPTDLPSESSSMPKAHELPIETNSNKSDAVAGWCSEVPTKDLYKSDEMASSSLGVPMKDIWMDPSINFAIKMLTGAIPMEEELDKSKGPAEAPEPSTKSSFGDLWGDPCIAFAVKTLTGDIPVDDASIQDLFLKGDRGSEFGHGPSGISNSAVLLTSCLPQDGNNCLQKPAAGGAHTH